MRVLNLQNWLALQAWRCHGRDYTLEYFVGLQLLHDPGLLEHL